MFEGIEHPNLAQALGVFRLANHYERGCGVAKDIPKALKLYQRSAAAGHIPSKINLARRRTLRGIPFAIWPWVVAALHGQCLVPVKGPEKGWEDPRMKL